MTVRTAHRSRTIAAIHVMAAQLGMDTTDKRPASEYRSALFTIGRAYSCNDMDYTALERVREHFTRLVRMRGIKNGRRAPADGHRDPAWDWVNRAAEDRRPMLWKIRAMLRAAGREKEYADGIATAMFRIDDVKLCGPHELRAIITALNRDAQRHPSKEPA